MTLSKDIKNVVSMMKLLDESRVMEHSTTDEYPIGYGADKRETEQYTLQRDGTVSFFACDESYHNGSLYNTCSIKDCKLPKSVLERMTKKLYEECLKRSKRDIVEDMAEAKLKALGISRTLKK